VRACDFFHVCQIVDAKLLLPARRPAFSPAASANRLSISPPLSSHRVECCKTTKNNRVYHKRQTDRPERRGSSELAPFIDDGNTTTTTNQHRRFLPILLFPNASTEKGASFMPHCQSSSSSSLRLIPSERKKEESVLTIIFRRAVYKFYVVQQV